MIVPIHHRELAAALAQQALAAIRCPTLPDVSRLGDYTVIALVEQDQLCGIAVFYGFENGVLHYCFHGVDRRWGTRANVRDLGNYVFAGTRVRRVESTCRGDDAKAIKVNRTAGFVREGLRRQGWAPGVDAIDFGMIRADWQRWLERHYGQEMPSPKGRGFLQQEGGISPRQGCLEPHCDHDHEQRRSRHTSTASFADLRYL